ncbi:hypothetical protein LARV_00392 [Longilinea arvoryzae]|uniref:Uncharacterized protein n=1 Tax=Longilinea arvoryzae TaxID=360412 RepID=A0A0S7BCZ2_9CHLR|nr:hypothetical protein [Longilinea arvoryzae]GAP12656.1 hypothetical protein LARV_00392 [Longilinea arvoryzae]
MKKFTWMRILFLAVLLVGIVLPVRTVGVQAADIGQSARTDAADPSQLGSDGGALSPAAYFAVGLMALLFGGLTFLPLLREDNPSPAADR